METLKTKYQTNNTLRDDAVLYLLENRPDLTLKQMTEIIAEEETRPLTKTEEMVIRNRLVVYLVDHRPDYSFKKIADSVGLKSRANVWWIYNRWRTK